MDTQNDDQKVPKGDTTDIEDVKKEAELFNEAKKLYNEKSYRSAAQMFSRVAQVLSKFYGDEGIELAETYYYYGDSLYLASQERGKDLLGTVFEEKIENTAQQLANEEGGEDEGDELEDDGSEEHGDESENEGSENNEKERKNEENEEEGKENNNGELNSLEGDDVILGKTKEEKNIEEGENNNLLENKLGNDEGEAKEEKNIEEGENKDLLENKLGNDESESKESKEENIEEDVKKDVENDQNSSDSEEDNDEESLADIDLAWEVMETARRILSTQTDPKSQILLSDVYSTLGHLQEEQENVDGAISEYKKSLTIRIAQLTDKDRSTAEAHYALGVALCGVPNRFEEALKHLEESKNILYFHTKNNTDPEIIQQLLDVVKDIDVRIEELRTKPEPLINETSLANTNEGTRDTPTPIPDGGIQFNTPTITTPIINLGVIRGVRSGDVSTDTTNTTTMTTTCEEGQSEESKKRKYSETLGDEKEAGEPDQKKLKTK